MSEKLKGKRTRDTIPIIDLKGGPVVEVPLSSLDPESAAVIRRYNRSMGSLNAYLEGRPTPRKTSHKQLLGIVAQRRRGSYPIR